MNCEECGRWCGNLQVVWNDDPWICSEECAYKRNDKKRQNNNEL